ncbi:MAG: GGDEF domain-containing protein [Arcobacter sp.]|nr:GGDEF domain-containing protein [Arcobacter sp.]
MKLEDIILYFKNTYELKNQVACIHKEGDNNIILFIDKNLIEKFIYKNTEIINTKKTIDISTILHNDDSEIVIYENLNTFKEKETINIRFITITAEIIILNLIIEKIYNDIDNTIAIYAHIEDVKELIYKQNLEKISEINFNAMLEFTNDFIFFKDKHHVITASSESMAKITGYNNKEELIGKTDYEIFPHDHADKYYQLEKEIYNGRENIEDIQPFYDENGNEGWVNNRKYPIKDKDGEIIGLFGIARIITEEVKIKKKLDITLGKLESFANNDTLTNITNRRYGLELIENAILDSKRYNDKISLIMFDVDNFKKINDTYGHKCGDLVLINLVKITQSTLRKNDIFCRFGGEEFIICLPKTNIKTAITISERIKQALNQNIIKPIKGYVEVSGGIVERRQNQNINDIIEEADKLLYNAKNNGRNQFIHNVN